MANPPAPDPMTVFDRRTLRRHRMRAAAAPGDHGFLAREVADRLAGRLDDVRRGFPRVLILGGHGGLVRAALEGRGGIEFVVECDMSPFVTLRDAGDLLQRAGFALPVADSDIITVTYADAFALMRDLRAMGETNAAWARRRTFSRRDTMFAAAARYAALFGTKDGRIPATFQILTLTAWAPDAAQPKPLLPGSANARLADALGVDEKPAGEKAG